MVVVLVLFAAALAAASSASQQPTGQNGSTAASQAATQNQPEMTTREVPTTFRVRVNLVLVPVVVRDSQGKAVGDLRREDFQLSDRGKPQVIKYFSAETPESRTARTEERAKQAAAPQDNQPRSEMPRRFVAYLFDDVHLDFDEISQTRAAMERQLSTLHRPSDRVALYTATGEHNVEFTDDLKTFTNQLARVGPSGSAPPECPDLGVYAADWIDREGVVNFAEVRAQSATDYALREAVHCPAVPCSRSRTGGCAPDQSTLLWLRIWVRRTLMQRDADNRVWLAQLRAVVRRLAAVPAERAIVAVSPGFHLNRDSGNRDVDQVIDEAVRAGIIINALDARGVYVVLPMGDAAQRRAFDPQQASQRTYWMLNAAAVLNAPLEYLAEGTGGVFVHSSNDFDAGFRQTAAAPEYAYVLGFSPVNLRMDGSFHDLKVRIRGRRGLKIAARRAYYVPKRSADPVEAARQEVETAMFAQDEVQEIPLELTTQYFKTSPANAKLNIFVRVDVAKLPLRKEGDRNRDVLDVYAALFDRNGNFVIGAGKIIELRLRDQTLANLASGLTLKTPLDVKTGNYLLRVVVREAEGQLLSARNKSVQIQ